MSDYAQRIAAIPIWQGALEFELLKGGLSNESFTVSNRGEKFVVRFGQDYPFHHVDRAREIMVTRAAFLAGLAPELVYAEPGIMVSRFIAGKTFAAEDVRANLPRICTLVRQFHQEMPHHVSGAGFIFWVFHVIRDYARTLRDGNSRMVEKLPEFVSLADSLETVQVPLPIIFGHHDFLPANFIDDGDKLWLIDFEYAGFSTPMFDLAGIASNALFSPAQAEDLLTLYFGRAPDPALARSLAAMQCASLLRETMWSLVSELHLNAPGVDYAAYTQENLDRLRVSLDAYRSHYGAV